jgi:hypothetical protein
VNNMTPRIYQYCKPFSCYSNKTSSAATAIYLVDTMTNLTHIYYPVGNFTHIIFFSNDMISLL